MDKASKKNLLIGVTGSVAAIKLIEILRLLYESELFEIRVMLSEKALTFVDKNELLKEFSLNKLEVFSDQDEWGVWKKKGDPVVHIDLRKWADILLITPLSANSLAKIANGLCDNLITCVVRAWDFSLLKTADGDKTKEIDITIDQRNYKMMKKPIIVAPSMNSFMFDNVFTKKHLIVTRELNIVDLETISKTLACGDIGFGAMAEPKDIVKALLYLHEKMETYVP